MPRASQSFIGGEKCILLMPFNFRSVLSATKAVLLEGAITDEFGHAVHNECYLTKLRSMGAIGARHKPLHIKRMKTTN